MRGDGPATTLWALMPIGCSPHARGWTEIADMAGATAAGVPRMRGDGPVGLILTDGLSECSPHARGWTAYHIGYFHEPSVFPACAGMDRSSARCSQRCARVPRMRGDGPSVRAFRRAGWRCSPHARGWTVFEGAVIDGCQVFPACAGMDRGRSRRTLNSRRVPRMRGDGPTQELHRQQLGTCSPHARGWTVTTHDSLGPKLVFPACAGMDRATSAPECGRRGVPRMRGDGPATGAYKCAAPWCSPHVRGWTGWIDLPTLALFVFPACAGMDRLAPIRYPTTSGVPRMRGDGPAGFRAGRRK